MVMKTKMRFMEEENGCTVIKEIRREKIIGGGLGLVV